MCCYERELQRRIIEVRRESSLVGRESLEGLAMLRYRGLIERLRLRRPRDRRARFGRCTKERVDDDLLLARGNGPRDETVH